MITLARGNEQRRELCDKFDKIFSHHVYAVVKKGTFSVIFTIPNIDLTLSGKMLDKAQNFLHLL